MKKGGQSKGEGRVINDIQVSSLGDRKKNHGNRSKCGWGFGEDDLGNAD